jgi:hypothetical protein
MFPKHTFDSVYLTLAIGLDHEQSKTLKRLMLEFVRLDLETLQRSGVHVIPVMRRLIETIPNHLMVGNYVTELFHYVETSMMLGCQSQFASCEDPEAEALFHLSVCFARDYPTLLDLPKLMETRA